MKKIFILICLFIFTAGAYAQDLNESDVPDPVKTAFNALYPNADNVEWEAEGAYFEGGVMIDGFVTSVLFDADGKVIQTASQVSETDLPQGITSYVSENIKSGKIDTAAKITDASGAVTYQTKINGSDYIFDKDGKLMYGVSGETESDNESNENK